jgi:hypothetical protein
MNPHSVEHVSVWLEDGLSNDKVFSQALEWACRLSLPLRAVVASRRSYVRPTSQASRMAPHEKIDQSQSPVAEKMNAWGHACTQRGVALEMFMWLDDNDAAMNQFLRPHGLCVCVDEACPRTQELLNRSAGNHDNAVLLCAPTCRSVSRLLVLFDQPKLNVAYLENVASFCNALEVHPIILVVAKSERDAQVQQGYAEGVCNSFQLLADVDFVVGCDVRSAVSRVASWRSCSHLIIERRIEAAARHRFHGDAIDRFRGLTDSLSLLALPESVVLDVPHPFRKEAMRLFGKAARLGPKRPADQDIATEVGCGKLPAASEPTRG